MAKDRIGNKDGSYRIKKSLLLNLPVTLGVRNFRCLIPLANLFTSAAAAATNLLIPAIESGD
jgi:hypothetical protein